MLYCRTCVCETLDGIRPVSVRDRHSSDSIDYRKHVPISLKLRSMAQEQAAMGSAEVVLMDRPPSSDTVGFHENLDRPRNNFCQGSDKRNIFILFLLMMFLQSLFMFFIESVWEIRLLHERWQNICKNRI